jgi:hypothetical protein
MLNKEKYMNELLEFACTDNKFAITKDGKLRECRGVRCNECAFENDGMASCGDSRRKWMEQEYKEPHVDWSKIPVDTPILVRNEGVGKEWEKRYFARYIDGKIYAWPIGTTSWSHGNKAVSTWDYAKLAESEESHD